MQKSKLYARTDYESTIYSICMYRKFALFHGKTAKNGRFLVKNWVFWPQTGSCRAPHFEGARCKKACCVDTLIAQTQFTAFLCPKICHFSTKSAKNSHLFIKYCLFFLA